MAAIAGLSPLSLPPYELTSKDGSQASDQSLPVTPLGNQTEADNCSGHTWSPLLTTPPDSASSHSQAKEHHARPPTSVPPTWPLPPIPSAKVPSKPKLQPKRSSSRSPSPFSSFLSPFKGEPESTDITGTSISLQRPLRRPRRQVRRITHENTQEDFDPLNIMHTHAPKSRPSQSGDGRRSEEGRQQGQQPPHSASPGPTYSSFGSPFDTSRQIDLAFGSYTPSPGATPGSSQRHSPTASSTFSASNGPLLLNTSIENARGGSRPSPSGLGPGCRSTDWAEGRFSRQSRVQSPPLHRGHGHQQQVGGTDDVVMQDDKGEGSEDDDVEYLMTRPSAPSPYPSHGEELSEGGSHGDMYEPAWTDETSCIDVNEQPSRQEMLGHGHSSSGQRAKSPIEETFEVESLRRQVEQLQMALKKQMVAMDRPRQRTTSAVHSPKRQHQLPATSSFYPSTGGVRYPFGLPSPDASRDSSALGARKAPSSKSASRDYHGGEATYVDRYHSSQLSPQRNGMGLPTDRAHAPSSPFTQQHDLQHGAALSSKRVSPRPRVTSDPPTMSSLLGDESASSFGRGEESQRMEELAKKIEALERMFQTSSLSPPPGERSFPTQPQSQQHHQAAATPTPQVSGQIAHRTASLSTISTRDGGTYGRSRSPAMSAFNYNVTPYSRNVASDNSLPSHSSHGDNGSSIALNRRKKGVARFIMGVGISRGNAPREGEVPTMQVSWSRKRTEKVAKPDPNARMKVGPGRGRMVIQPKPPASSL